MALIADLPIELLRTILRYSTNCAADKVFPVRVRNCSPEYRSASEYSGIFPGVLLRDGASLKAKQALVNVSKQLRMIGREFLYETVHIRTFAQVSRFRAALESGPHHVSEGTDGAPGSLVKLLSIGPALSTDCVIWSDDELAYINNSSEYYDNVPATVKACPNLRVLALNDYVLSMQLLEAIPINLLYLDITSLNPFVERQRWYSPDNTACYVLKFMPTLRALRTPSLRPTGPDDDGLFANLTHLSLPCLSFTKASVWYANGPCILPALTSMTIGDWSGMEASPSDDWWQSDFWQIIRPSLLSLHLSTVANLSKTALLTVLRCSPNLEELQYPLSKLPDESIWDLGALVTFCCRIRRVDVWASMYAMNEILGVNNSPEEIKASTNRLLPPGDTYPTFRELYVAPRRRCLDKPNARIVRLNWAWQDTIQSMSYTVRTASRGGEVNVKVIVWPYIREDHRESYLYFGPALLRPTVFYSGATCSNLEVSRTFMTMALRLLVMGLNEVVCCSLDNSNGRLRQTENFRIMRREITKDRSYMRRRKIASTKTGQKRLAKSWYMHLLIMTMCLRIGAENVS